MDRSRMFAWCRDLSGMFLLGEQDNRVEEWAERGLSIAASDRQVELIRILAAARLNLRDFQGAESACARGLQLLPSDAELHHYRGRALQGLGRGLEAAGEYEVSLRLSPGQRNREALRAEIARIRSGEGNAPPAR